MVLCWRSSVRPLGLFQVVEGGVQMVVSELSRRRGKRGKTDSLSSPPVHPRFLFLRQFFARAFNLNAWNSLARPEQVFV